MELIVFNVDHGLCVLVKTPSGYGVMIDVGSRRDFSPAKWIADGRISLRQFQGKKLTYLIVTHPHDDHVEGISNLAEYLPPAVLKRRKGVDWNKVLNPPDGDPSPNAKFFYRWQATYNQTVSQMPEFGCQIEVFGLTDQEITGLGGQLQNQVNNGSYVTVFTWDTPSFTWKVVICGDNETDGLNAMLRKPKFADAIHGAQILVTPHHGHASGFSSAFMSAIGTPRVLITSVQSQGGNDHVDPRYHGLADGIVFGGRERHHLTTRKDGHIRFVLNTGSFKVDSVCDFNALASLLLSHK